MKFLLSTILTLFLLNEVTAQDKEVVEIRKLYNEIQQNKSSYIRLAQEDFESSSEGGQLTAYKDENGIRLIETVHYGHMGKIEHEYYFSNGQLYFAFAKTYKYNAPPTQLEYDNSQTTIEEYRYYFWNSKMIRCIKPDGSFLEMGSDEFVQQEQRISELASMALKQFE
ncbi:hypothetical protein QWY31_10295 [Cytophagales bacterium LB-30]|uniref:MORN repeat variant n=1 Tax=Shiella aurantiaca TaxID=3058365 RepID=A0ABT8F6L1_9BACT|nr:hypothetical protein [Shiella aurantiaca]MDN4165894.1 hypothetical protein [Shiella aurantiaca]